MRSPERSRRPARPRSPARSHHIWNVIFLILSNWLEEVKFVSALDFLNLLEHFGNWCNIYFQIWKKKLEIWKITFEMWKFTFEIDEGSNSVLLQRPWWPLPRKVNPLPMNRRNDSILTPSHPSGEWLPYSQDRALFISIVEMGVFFILHILQIARVANCKCWKLQLLHKCCKVQVLQSERVANCNCC